MLDDHINPWDGLAPLFANEDSTAITADAADNILIAWPVVLACIAAHFGAPPYHGRRVLDYGCGGGRFTAHLSELGFDASGLDTSKE